MTKDILITIAMIIPLIVLNIWAILRLVKLYADNKPVKFYKQLKSESKLKVIK